MEKILKKYSTIPEHLYVRRKADEELKRIVDEMERPGYVLVARQMGKTNLLINAKRTLQNEDRLFVYVDLSNVFNFERDCYRNIINNIIEPNEDIFYSIEKDINSIRQQDLPPHIEYSKSLRTILNCYNGILVVILDEIDALKSVEYSDHIFAQIRSNYFSRTNFPILNRLTYILSGVIEPVELIKDKNKSPFNIGDKIYLDDFTFDEHENFIKKSQLDISHEISNEIFSWTNGHPRLTFEICSEVENYLIENGSISINNIYDIIKKKYLTNFDIAPIDHIREMVKSSKPIRKAVYNILIGKNDISDEIKNKLYLYGIINSNFDSFPKIKNKIIEFSLSIDWINSIEKLTQDDYNYGLEKMDNGEFMEAIKLLTAFISNSSPTNTQLEVCSYNLGFAYYKLRELENAIVYFSKDYSIPLYKNNAKSLLGICKLGTGHKAEGISILESIISENTNDFAYRNAILNLAPILPKHESERALSLYNDLYNSTSNSQDEAKDDELNKIRTLALYYQAEIFQQQHQDIKALEKIREAKQYANQSDLLYLIFYEYTLETNKNQELKKELINRIVDSKISFDINNTYPISFNEVHLLYYIALVYESTNLKLFNKILKYSEESLYNNFKSKYDIVYEASRISKDKQVDLLNFILDSNIEIKESLLINIYRDLTFQNSKSSVKYLFNFYKFLEIFKSNEDIISTDIYLFALAIRYNSDKGNISEGLRLCEIIDEKLIKQEDEELLTESIMIYYWYANLFFSKSDKKQSILYADKTLNIIRDSKKERTSMIDEKGLKSISDQMLQIKNSANIRKPIIVNKQYGRNDKIKVKYLDGGLKEGKYKHFEADILAERCKII